MSVTSSLSANTLGSRLESPRVEPRSRPSSRKRTSMWLVSDAQTAVTPEEAQSAIKARPPGDELLHLLEGESTSSSSRLAAERA